MSRLGDRRWPSGLGQGVRAVCLLRQGDYKPGDLPPSGYLAWHEWATVQHDAGLRQKQCGECGRWKYPQELSDEVLTFKAFRVRRGIGREDVEVHEPLCLACAELRAAHKRRVREAPDGE